MTKTTPIARKFTRFSLIVSLSGALAAGTFAAPAQAAPVANRGGSKVTPPNVVYPIVGASALRLLPTTTVPSDPSLGAAPSTDAVAPDPVTPDPADTDPAGTDLAGTAAAAAAAAEVAPETAAPTPLDPTDSPSPTGTPVPAPVPAAAADATVDPAPGADVATRCGAGIVASTPGQVVIEKNVPWAGGRLVKVVTDGEAGLTTTYGHLRDITVTDGQVVLSGELLGHAGSRGVNPACKTGKPAVLHFEVTATTSADVDEKAWLAQNAGKPIPGGTLFGNEGFRLATFNVLGASHTGRGSQHPGMAGYATRLKRTIKVFNANGVDVVGLQEFQSKQRQLFMKTARKNYAIYPFSADSDPENSIMWRNRTFDFVDGGTFAITYFNGNLRRMPWVKLRFKDGGRYPAMAGREAYFLNIHNPATIWGYRGSAKWRKKAIATEIRVVNKLRETGLPVFLTGDFNDKAAAYCPLSTKADLVSPQGGSEGSACDFPKGKTYIDWIFVSGDATFSRYDVDTSVRGRISDHNFFLSRAHLAEQ